MKAILYLLLPAAIWAGQARYARLGRFEGPVEVQLGAAEAWIAAERNLPLIEGAWVRTGPAARVEVELDDGGVWRLGPDSQGEISDYTRLSTGQGVTLLSLDRGLAYFSGQARGLDAVILAAPGAQVAITRPARIRMAATEATSQIWVLAGSLRFSSPAVEMDLGEKQTVRVEPDLPARFYLDRETPSDETGRWSAERDKALAGPVSALHVVARYGLADLDSAGEWINSDELGTVWKPKVDDAWVPFQNGRWRWYAALGYTWTSDDPWGWQPYHYGRWTHSKELGWLWVPTVSQVFKPGEVYWMRGPQLVGWGPLAPGERFTPAPAVLPRLFYDAYTTFAGYTEGAATIVPAGSTDRPKEPLKAARFTAALPSPLLDASRFDATRPVARAGSTRIRPVLPGVTYQGDQPAILMYSPETTTQAAPAPVVAPPPVIAPPPVVIVNNPPPAEQVLVPYPVAVYQRREAAAKSDKKWQSDAERALFLRVLAEQDQPVQQIRHLDEWRQRFPQSRHGIERAYFYMQAYDRVSPPDPAKILEYGTELVAQDVKHLFESDDVGRTQALSVLYLATAAVAKLPHPSPSQLRTGTLAAQQLVAYIPGFFAPNRRPSNITVELWRQARADMETAARKTLSMAGPPHL